MVIAARIGDADHSSKTTQPSRSSSQNSNFSSSEVAVKHGNKSTLHTDTDHSATTAGSNFYRILFLNLRKGINKSKY